jgi:hypothetical protein
VDREITKGVTGDRNHESDLRALIYIPIIHAQADLGELGAPIRRLKIKKLGRAGWERNANLIRQFWARIEQAIDSLVLPYERVRLYQDGLPNCGREVEIVTELAKAGSPNHRLLVALIEKCATLVGTESPELLLEEYQLIQQTLERRAASGAAGFNDGMRGLGRSLLERRDRYIAARISGTLGAGETGIVFLGLLHSPQGLLAPDIRLSYPLGRPAPCERARGS